MTPAELAERGIRIKPLDWEEPCQRNNYTHIARSVYGEYYVHVDGGRHQAFLEAHEKPYEVFIGAEVGCLFSAQAAAEADHAAASARSWRWPPRRDPQKVAALFVEAGGSYYGLDNVDPWDQARDARRYDGPHPVIAHPPCQRWGKLWAGQPLWIKRTGERKVKGDDDGCFASALATVRRAGGVLEHPWGSHAWAHFGLAMPPRAGGWIIADDYGWTCCVEQGRYGHYARKPTLLYAVGCRLPELDWGISQPTFPPEAIAKHGLAYCKRAGELAFKGGGKDNSHRIGTPPAFRALLIALAMGVT